MPEAAPVSDREIRTFRSEGVVKIDFVKVIGPELYAGLLKACGEIERSSSRPHAATRISGGDLRLRVPEIDAVARSSRVGRMARMLAGAEHYADLAGRL